MSEEREKRPNPAEFHIVDKDGVSLTINFGNNISISLEEPNRDGVSTDFPFVKNGVCRYPQTVKALEVFRSPDVPKVPLELLPITVSTKEDASGKDLMISVTSEGNIHVTIKGKSSKGAPSQGVTFTLGHLDEGFIDRLLSAFTNLALAIQEDEKTIQRT